VARKDYPVTPDGRYFVARGQLWRRTDPALPDGDRRAAVKALMRARRAVRDAGDDGAMRAARAAVQTAKERLGERGPVWWDDGAPDEGGRAPWNSSYAAWWTGLDDTERDAGA
jgi:hypothetical protein